MAGMAGLKLEARNGQLDEADERQFSASGYKELIWVVLNVSEQHSLKCFHRNLQTIIFLY